MLNLSSLTVQQLERAVAIKQQIESLRQELDSLDTSKGSVVTPKPNRPKLGATDGRIKTLKLAKEAKGANYKASTGLSSTFPTPELIPSNKANGTPKLVFSPEHRAKLAKASQARWAKVKAQGKTKP